MKKHDVIIIGGGPGGSVAGSVLARNGVDVAIFEREEYPRFHIGESLLPATMPIFKEIGFYETLSDGRYIEKYGARFIDYQTSDEVYFGFDDGLNRDIPMAFEVERCELDRDLLKHARKCGARVYQPETVKDVQADAHGAVIRTDRDEYTARYVMDVTGRDSFLGMKMKLRQANKDLNNVAVFAHYKGVERQPGRHEGDIIIGLLPNRAWTWVIPFKGDVTSVGVVCSSSFFDGENNWGEYLERTLRKSPKVEALMAGSKQVMDIQRIGNYSHTCETFFGDRWILSGDAALFLDPIFSSGVHMSTSSSKFAAETILKAMKKNIGFRDENLGRTYEEHVRKGAKRFHNLISLFYEGTFVEQMKKTLTRENMRKGFTSAVAGDVWNDDNFLFQKNVL